MLTFRKLKFMATIVATGLILTITGALHASAIPPNLTGTVVFAATSQPAGGAWILVHAMINNPPEDGSVFTEPVIAQAQTNSLGQFSITVDHTPELAAIADANDGWLNVELYVQTTTTTSSVLGTVSVTYEAVQQTAMQTVDNAGSADGKAFEATGPLQIALAETAGQTGVATGQTPNPQPGPACGEVQRRVIEQSDPYVVIGEFHAYEDVAGTHTYGKVSETWLGVGYKVGGKSWSVSGSTRSGTTYSNSVSFNRGPYFGKQLKSQFHYVKYEIKMECAGQSGYRTDYEIRATRWNGGAIEGKDVSSFDGYQAYTNKMQTCGEQCIQAFDHDTTYSTGVQKGHVYTAEIVVMTVKLNAETDWSNRVDSTWRFGPQPWAHYLFGNNGPITTASIIYSY